VDHELKNPERGRAPLGAPRQSFGEQLRAFLRRNALWFLVVALAWLLIQDVFGTHGVLAMHRSQLELQKIQGEIKQLDEENQRLQDNVKNLKSDPTTMEGIAREDLGLARPGEIVFRTKQKPADRRTDPAKKQ
jgi:cell division protein FtsB